MKNEIVRECLLMSETLHQFGSDIDEVHALAVWLIPAGSRQEIEPSDVDRIGVMITIDGEDCGGSHCIGLSVDEALEVLREDLKDKCRAFVDDLSKFTENQ